MFWVHMVTCLLCSSPASIGLLCTAHGVAIASPGITSEQIVSRVRRKLASVQADDLIESKRGVGYRLAGDPG
jgi:hypothetical protein